MALAAYRNVLRSTRIAFQGDLRTLIAARVHARQAFEQNRNLEGEALSQEIGKAEEVAKMLRENVVQGIAGENNDGHFSRFILP
jgi:complex III assembly factor LYRM7